MPGNGHVPFGKGPSEKDPCHGHLVGGLLHPTIGGWWYLATVIDLATREVVGYAMADHHRAELVTDALRMAAGRGDLRPGCIMHSDRGSEYTSSEFRATLRKLGLSRAWAEPAYAMITPQPRASSDC
jgi:transposase InsO family protein